MIKYKEGNLFDDLRPNDYLIHIVNDVNKFNAGFAKAIIDRLPCVKESYHDWFIEPRTGNWAYKVTGPPTLGNVQFFDYILKSKYLYGQEKNCRIAQMMAQHGVRNKNNPHPLDFDALTTCLKHVWADLCFQHLVNQRYFRVIAPRFGSGLGGGNWDKIVPIIKRELSGSDITIYTL